MKTAQQNTTHTLIPEAQLKLKKAHRTKGDKRTSQGGGLYRTKSLTKHNNKVYMQWHKGDKDCAMIKTDQSANIQCHIKETTTMT